MPTVAHSGRGRISMRHPRGLGVCDRCGFWHNHKDLIRQFAWGGNTLFDTGLLVGRDCLDVPQPQFRSIILPPDPYPLINPRPAQDITPAPIVGQPLPTTPSNQGFTQYTLGAATPGLYPTTMASALAEVVTYSGIASPATIASYAIPLPRNATTTILNANSDRAYLLVYNPTQMPAQISLGTAVLGGLNNLSIGPGEAYFWATAQGLGTVYRGAMTAISPWGGSLPLWVWEDDGGTSLINDGGVLVLAGNAFPGWPTTSAGAAGSVYSNGGMCSVVSGAAPVPYPALIYGSVTASELLLLGGTVLPTTGPTAGSLRLWNAGGVIQVA